MNSRSQQRSNHVWRRRKCLSCQAAFTTEETVQYASAWAIKSKNGRLQPFSRDKLLFSLHRSLQHRKNALEAASGLTDTVVNKLMLEMRGGALHSSRIVQTALVALSRFDKPAAVHYRAFHKS